MIYDFLYVIENRNVGELASVLIENLSFEIIIENLDRKVFNHYTILYKVRKGWNGYATYLTPFINRELLEFLCEE